MSDTTKIENFKSSVQRLSEAVEGLRAAKEEGKGIQAAVRAVTEAQSAAAEAGLAAWQDFAGEARKQLVTIVAGLAPAAFSLADPPGASSSEDLRAGVDPLFESGEIAQALQALHGTDDPARITGGNDLMPADTRGVSIN
jgi:hypothetical protein